MNMRNGWVVLLIFEWSFRYRDARTGFLGISDVTLYTFDPLDCQLDPLNSQPKRSKIKIEIFNRKACNSFRILFGWIKSLIPTSYHSSWKLHCAISSILKDSGLALLSKAPIKIISWSLTDAVCFFSFKNSSSFLAYDPRIWHHSYAGGRYHFSKADLDLLNFICGPCVLRSLILMLS